MPFFRFTTVLAAALAGGLFLAAAQVRAQAPARWRHQHQRRPSPTA